MVTVPGHTQGDNDLPDRCEVGRRTAREHLTAGDAGHEPTAIIPEPAKQPGRGACDQPNLAF